MVTIEEATELRSMITDLQLDRQQQDKLHIMSMQALQNQLNAAEGQLLKHWETQQLLEAADSKSAALAQQFDQQQREAKQQQQIQLQEQAVLLEKLHESEQHRLQAMDQLRHMQQQQLQQLHEMPSRQTSADVIANLQQQLAAASQQIEESSRLVANAEEQKEVLAKQVSANVLGT
jgi:hypothetical protein